MDRRTFLCRSLAVSALVWSESLRPTKAGRALWIIDASGDPLFQPEDAEALAPLVLAGTLFRGARAPGLDAASGLRALLSGQNEPKLNDPHLFTLAAAADLPPAQQWWISNKKPAEDPVLAIEGTRPSSFRPAAAANPNWREWLADRRLSGSLPPMAGEDARRALLAEGEATLPLKASALCLELLLKDPGPRPLDHDLAALLAAERIARELAPALLVVHLEAPVTGAEDKAARRRALVQLHQRLVSDKALAAEMTFAYCTTHEPALAAKKDLARAARVPVWFAGPEVAGNKAPRRSVRAIDVLPTLLQRLGKSPGRNLDARPLDLKED